MAVYVQYHANLIVFSGDYCSNFRQNGRYDKVSEYLQPIAYSFIGRFFLNFAYVRIKRESIVNCEQP